MKLKFYILFLIVTLTPSETVSVSGEVGSCCREQCVINLEDSDIISCLSEKMNALVAYISSSGRNEKLTEYVPNKPYSIDKNKRFPTPFFLDIVVRTTDWFSHFKVNLSRLSDFKTQKESYQYQLRTYLSVPDNVYIPPLKYYVYTLEKIIT